MHKPMTLYCSISTFAIYDHVIPFLMVSAGAGGVTLPSSTFSILVTTPGAPADGSVASFLVQTPGNKKRKHTVESPPTVPWIDPRSAGANSVTPPVSLLYWYKSTATEMSRLDKSEELGPKVDRNVEPGWSSSSNNARQNWLFASPGKVKVKKPAKKEQAKTQATTIMTFFNKSPVTTKPPSMRENKELESGTDFTT